MKLTRREFIGLSGTAIAVPLIAAHLQRQSPSSFPGEIRGADARDAHKLWSGISQSPQSTEQHGVVIVGSGISGLSAAWKLSKLGIQDYVILDLEACPGGNAQHGENVVSAFPWGAHYVTVPGEERNELHELFDECGVIDSYDASGKPHYNDYYLCAAPHSRLFIHGQWQEGVLPSVGVSDEDRRQYKDFFSFVYGFSTRRGRDKKLAFQIPLRLSSQDAEFIEYDRQSFANLLNSQGWNSEYLRWYVDYCCRDDFGARAEFVSAWAGIHYFASRTAYAANVSDYGILTWPEGNGFLVNHLTKNLGDRIRLRSLVFRVENSENGSELDYLDIDSGVVRRILSKAVIYAAPRFTASYVIRSTSPAVDKSLLRYTPWMVANITLHSQLSSETKDNFAWDNVFFNGNSLGYVHATHQDIKRSDGRTVLTYYLPLDEEEPAMARQSALTRSVNDWQEIVLKDLKRAHKDIERHIAQIDVWIWGHGMICPQPHYIWTHATNLPERDKNIFFAHSDMSGISIFEEAQYHGVRAAHLVQQHLTTA